MLKVIVADDEFFARKALIKMLEETGLPIEICGDCETGQDVVELLEKCTADLIITDIKMPGLDGLKLAEYLREHEMDTAIIIETGYADFEYARTAIRFDVKDYLIKPVNENELRKSIEKVILERSKRNEQVMWELLDFSYIFQNPKLCRQMLGWTREQEKSSYCMVLVNGKDKIGQKIFLEEWLGKQNEFERIQSFSSREKTECIFLIFSKKVTDPAECFGKVQKVKMIQQETEKIWISFSCWHRGEKELEQAYKECIYSMNERILNPGLLFFYSPKKEFCEIVTGEQEQRLYNAAQKGCEEEAKQVVWEIFSKADNEDVSIYSFFAALTQILYVLNKVSCQKEGQNSQEMSAEYLLFDFKMDLHQFYDLEGVRQYITMLLKEVCQKNPEKENGSMIEDLLNYLERNYSYDISLDELAKRKYFVSSSYLSRMFKSYTGVTFMKYLISIRMKKAKSLLECSQMDISDIAVCTGYNDPSHFTQSFRRFYGVTPKEYRKQGKF